MTILIDDPRITSIPVVDRGDPVVDLGDLAPTAVGAARLARRGLANRLHTANANLPDGIRMRVIEGCRTALPNRPSSTTMQAGSGPSSPSSSRPSSTSWSVGTSHRWRTHRTWLGPPST